MRGLRNTKGEPRSRKLKLLVPRKWSNDPKIETKIEPKPYRPLTRRIIRAFHARSKKGKSVWDEVDKVRRIESKMMTKLMIGTGFTLGALLHLTLALAQQQTIYGPDGKVQSRVTTDSQGSRTIYDAQGRVSGRTSTDSQGTTTIYDARGRKIGTTRNDRGSNEEMK